ncbi:MAG TPA: GNAT family N-acetyltransferase [Candidatus Paenibacillus intestinavium]|nr:GNAT family N-acetyltransferase [Candidatus Paenibacillus intestinavium]
MTSLQIINPSVFEDFHAFQATAEDMNVIRDLIVHTVNWLKSMGSTQWNSLPNEQDDHYLANAIANGEVIVFRKTGTDALAGSVILQQHPGDWDRKLWGAIAASKNDAIYLHRLIVNREYSSRELGSHILSWIDQSIQFTGRDRIKLDCIAHNEKLNAFYMRCGFTYMGETDGFIIYEKLLPDKL